MAVPRTRVEEVAVFITRLVMVLDAALTRMPAPVVVGVKMLPARVSQGEAL